MTQAGEEKQLWREKQLGKRVIGEKKYTINYFRIVRLCPWLANVFLTYLSSVYFSGMSLGRQVKRISKKMGKKKLSRVKVKP